MKALSLRHAGIVLAVFVLVMGAAAPTYAQTPGPTPQPGTGINNLYVVSDEPMEFDFLYGGRNQPAQILLGNPTGDAGFNVYADWQWRDMAAGNRSISPLGSGTANPNEPGKLFWEGSSPESGFYHVQVFSRDGRPASFWIALSGPGAASQLVPVNTIPPKPAQPVQLVTPVATPAASAAVQPVQTAAPTVLPTAAAAVQPAVTTAPTKPTAGPTGQATEAPRTGAGNWQTIAEPMEYVFRYGGNSLPARISVGSRPAGGIGFSVYTDQQWTELGNGRYWTVPVGRGTPNAYEAGDLFWEAQSPVPETYHIQIFRLGNQTAQFWIDMTGNGAVTGLQPKSPAVPAP